MRHAVITQRLERNRHGHAVDVLEHAYLHYFARFCGCITPLSNATKPTSALDKCDLLIVSGGGDLPGRFHNSGLNNPDDALAEQRFAMQSGAVQTVLANGGRVLAICYGMQLVNVLLGGQLAWGRMANESARRPGLDHRIRIHPENRLGMRDRSTTVNHYHHHAITTDQLAAGFQPLALDPDFGTVEAALHDSLPLLCLQWHPERPSPDDSFNFRLLESFFGS